jgi:hypothetical protein
MLIGEKRMCAQITDILRRIGVLRIIVVCLIVCIGASIFVLNGKFRGSPWKASSSLAEPSKQSNEKVEVELVTLQRWGFEPKEIARPKGKFLLVVENQSGVIQGLTFSLVEERGARLKEIKLGANRRKGWNDFVELNPGNYSLTVSERPEWRCTFTITEK